MAELRGQVEAIFEASCRHGECHDGDGETWLERQGCMEILQDLGDRLQEAHAHLQEIQEYPEDSRIRVKDFLDILFAAEVHKAETSVKEGSDVKKASTSEAHLRNYFQKDYKNGGAFDHEEYDFDVGDWCWVHKGLKIKVWADALDLTQAGGDGDVECYFHYTTELGFRNITHASKAAVEVFASLITSGEKANAWWGKGVYSVRKAPDEWPSVETILDNNYRNMLKRDIDLKGREAAIQESFLMLCGRSVRPTSPRLAFVLRKRGDLAEAEALRRRILDAYQAQWGAEHRQTLTALNNLAGVLEDQGKFEEAEPLHRRALEGREARLGARHPETFTSANNLALLLEKQGKFKEAEPLQRRVLEGREAQLGARHLDTLVSLNNLASLLWRQGKFEEAEPLYRKALEGREAQLGARHPDTLSSLNNLAALLFAQGKLEEAEPLFRRQLEGIEAQLGASHPNTLTFANNLGVLLLDRRKLDESEVFLHRAVEGREAQLGSQHPHTLRSVYHLARLSAAQGRLEEAQSHFRRAMEGQVAQLGVRHQETLDSISGLAKLLEAKGSMEEAHELYQRQLDALEELHGSDHPKTRACREHLEHLQRGDKRVKDFLDILFTSEVQKAEESMQERNQPGASAALEVHKIDTIVTEGSDVKKPSTSEAHLRNYFQKDYKNGGAFDHEEYDFDVGDWCWVHKGLKIKVWADALDLTQAGGDGDVECYFHYTTQLGFHNITHASKAAVEVFASLVTSGEKANAWWGKGVYSVRKAPDEWPSVETLLDNNYRNMLKRDTWIC
eukprot:g27443.t1